MHLIWFDQHEANFPMVWARTFYSYKKTLLPQAKATPQRLTRTIRQRVNRIFHWKKPFSGLKANPHAEYPVFILTSSDTLLFTEDVCFSQSLLFLIGCHPYSPRFSHTFFNVPVASAKRCYCYFCTTWDYFFFGYFRTYSDTSDKKK